MWAAISDHFEGRNGGRYLADVGEAGPTPKGADMTADGFAPWAYDEEAEEKLWEMSYEMVGLPVED